jgi:hypothetical protein
MARNQALAIVEDQLPSTEVDYDVLEEMERPDFARDEMAVPRLKVAQGLSPQLNKTKAEYIKGISAGDFFLNVTKEFWPGEEGVFLVPAAFHTTYVEWVPRSSGGGLVADRSDEEGIAELWARLRDAERSRLRREGGKDVARARTQDGNEIIKSADYYVLRVDPGTGAFQECVFTLGGTQGGKSRAWNTTINSRLLKRSDGRTFKPLPCAFMYHVTSVAESNDRGNWYGINPGIARLSGNEAGEVLRLPGGRAIYDAAKNLREMVQSGARRASVESTAEEFPAGGAGIALDSEIPF